MERQYLFFHTARGLVVACAGLAAGVLLVVVAARCFPERTWLHILMSATCGGGAIWLAFRADGRAVGRRKQ